MKTLLLNSTYEPLSFINEKKTFKLLFKEKAEIVSTWEDSYVNFKNQLIHYPAVIKLKKYVVRKIVKLEFSRKAVFRRDEYTCFTPDTNILMADGSLKEIKDIRLNDLIIDHEGNIQNVEYIHKKEIKENILEIYVRGNGNILRCTKNHKLLNTDQHFSFINSNGKEAEYLSVSDYLFNVIPKIEAIKYNDDLLLYNNIKHIKIINNNTIKLYSGHIINRFFNYDNDFGKLIGYYLAEGSIMQNCLAFTFNIKEKMTHANEVKVLFKKIFNLDVKLYEYPEKNTIRVAACSKLLTNLFKNLCYKNGIKNNENIKSFDSKNYTTEFLTGILHGVCYGDAHFSHKNKKVVLTLRLPNLINDIAIISNIVGIYPTISKTYSRKDGRIFKSLIYQSDNYNKLLFICNSALPRWESKSFSKNDRRIINNRFIVSKIQKIKEIKYSGYVYDLQISGSHTYIANGIAVHNCQYCLKPLCYRTATIDHIIPRKLGGQNNFLNCVTACTQCNRKKGNATLADSGMKLVKQPEHPSQYYYYITHVSENWHQDWKKFLDI